MKFHRVSAIARKELLHVLRDKRSLFMAIAIPVLMLVLYGYALNLDVDRIPLVVFDQSQSPESRQFISRFIGSRYFVECKRAERYTDVESDVGSGAAMAALIIPTEFCKGKQSTQKYLVQFIIDGSDPAIATQAQFYATSITEAYGVSLASRLLHRSGIITQRTVLNVCERAWYNPDLRSRNYLFPGLIAIMMTVISTVQTSLTIAREWESGTMEQLISTPVKAPELILGKLMPYFAIGMVNVLIAVLTARYVFDLPFRGGIGLLCDGGGF